MRFAQKQLTVSQNGRYWKIEHRTKIIKMIGVRWEEKLESKRKLDQGTIKCIGWMHCNNKMAICIGQHRAFVNGT